SGTQSIYTMTPSPGYAVADVTVDGVWVGSVGSYTFNNVNASHTISATFAKLIGINNKSALNDSKLIGRVVKVWGKVMGVNGTPPTTSTSFIISDGYNAEGVTVNVNGAALLSSFDVNKTVVVTGVLNSDKQVQAQTIIIYP
ncbi:MAG: hypothetical protein NT018_07275, partial [Armatimonadetes bacterium]|nr:hypothetical protein [Armatimonadota bacterium]